MSRNARELRQDSAAQRAGALGTFTSAGTLSLDEKLAAQRLTTHAARDRPRAPQEIADVVVFLLSRAARFVSGTVLRADGGQSPAVDY